MPRFYAGGSLQPGESVALTVSYAGGAGTVLGQLRVFSDDPDEELLPVQLFGRTDHLDPGETAPDFTLPRLVRDPEGEGYLEDSFRLADQLGKIVWFQVYGSW